MAFNFFNYDKEGPGVSKNEPEKKGIIRLFELYFKNFWKLMVSGIWYWLFTALPVVIGFGASLAFENDKWLLVCAISLFTAGPGAAGMTNVARNAAVDAHSFGTSDFFSTVKKNLKESILVGFFCSAIVAVLCYDIYAFVKSTGKFSVAGIGICVTAFFVFCAMRYYIWMMVITFKLPLRKVIANAFKFAFAGLKNNLLIFLGLIPIYAICYLLGSTGIGITQFLFVIVVLFIVPGYRFLIINYGVFPVIKKFMIDPYYAEHPDDDIELRKRLGLIKTDYSEEDLYQ